MLCGQVTVACMRVCWGEVVMRSDDCCVHVCVCLLGRGYVVCSGDCCLHVCLWREVMLCGRVTVACMCVCWSKVVLQSDDCCVYVCLWGRLCCAVG